MHQSAFEEAEKFLKIHLSEGGKVLDVGSYGVNGTLNDVCTKVSKEFHCTYKYVGLDIIKGINVNVHVEELELYPFKTNTFDASMSNSCFEHNRFFWHSFSEMVRVTRPGGFIYLCTPSAGPYHAYPKDCWRFYKDAYEALQDWMNYSRPEVVRLIDQYIVDEGPWYDNVGIFKIL